MADRKNGRGTGGSERTFDAEQERSTNTFGARLRRARTARKMSLAEVSAALEAYNIHVRLAAVGKWETGQTLPNPYQLFALCRILGIRNAEDYFTGSREDLNETGLWKLREYREDLIASGRYAVERPAPTPKVPEEPEEPEEPEILLPAFLLGAAAGTGTFLDSDYSELTGYPASEVPRGTDFTVHVAGDSMLPDYEDGQTLFVRQCETLRPGDIGIFSVDGCAYVKKYTETMPDEDELDCYLTSEGVLHPKVVLVSLNPDYPPIPVSPYSEFHIFGRVLN